MRLKGGTNVKKKKKKCRNEIVALQILILTRDRTHLLDVWVGLRFFHFPLADLYLRGSLQLRFFLRASLLLLRAFRSRSFFSAI